MMVPYIPRTVVTFHPGAQHPSDRRSLRPASTQVGPAHSPHTAAQQLLATEALLQPSQAKPMPLLTSVPATPPRAPALHVGRQAAPPGVAPGDQSPTHPHAVAALPEGRAIGNGGATAAAERSVSPRPRAEARGGLSSGDRPQPQESPSRCAVVDIQAEQTDRTDLCELFATMLNKMVDYFPAGGRMPPFGGTAVCPGWGCAASPWATAQPAAATGGGGISPAAATPINISVAPVITPSIQVGGPGPACPQVSAGAVPPPLAPGPACPQLTAGAVPPPLAPTPCVARGGEAPPTARAQVHGRASSAPGADRTTLADQQLRQLDRVAEGLTLSGERLQRCKLAAHRP